MTTPPTNDGTGKKPYRYEREAEDSWAIYEAMDLSILDIRPLARCRREAAAKFVVAKLNAHAAREPEIAELRRLVTNLSNQIEAAEPLHADIARLTAEVERLTKERDTLVLQQIPTAAGVAILTLTEKLAACEKESGARLKIIEAVGAALGNKYPSETRDSLAPAIERLVRERDEARKDQGQANSRLIDWIHSGTALTASLRVATEALERDAAEHKEQARVWGSEEGDPDQRDYHLKWAERAHTALRTIRQGETVKAGEKFDVVFDLKKPPCPTCGGTKVVDASREIDGDWYNDQKPCPTCCPTPDETVSAKVTIGDPPESFQQCIHPGCLSRNYGAVAVAWKCDFHQPTKENLCDPGIESSVGGRSDGSPCAPPVANVTGSDPPATRDAGEGPRKLAATIADALLEGPTGRVSKELWKLNSNDSPIDCMDRDTLIRVIEAQLPTYTAGRASVSPVLSGAIDRLRECVRPQWREAGWVQVRATDLLEVLNSASSPAPHAEFVAAFKKLEDEVRQAWGFMGGAENKYARSMMEALNAALALAPAQEGV